MYWYPNDWKPEQMGKDESVDYLEDYRQFKNHLKSEYHPISVSLFLKFYPRIVLQKEIMKLLKLKP